MAIARKSDKPTGITNAAGEPELILDIEGLTLSFNPPAKAAPPDDDDDEPTLR
jgi:hypothetical protein